MKLFLLAIFLIISAASSLSIKPRIIGGRIANAGQFPYMAAINVATASSRFFCGGTLISNQWILTAGQCVDGAVLFEIYLGTHHLKQLDVNSVRVTTSNYVLHPDYNRFTLENDIGLIQLRMPVLLTDYIKPIITFPKSDLAAGTPETVTVGWGQIDDETAGTVDALRYVYISAITNEECKLIYGSQIVDTMVCAIGNFNEGFCTDDSGGGLVHYRRGGYVIIVGVASFISNNGCESTDASGYTRVYPYMEWIRNETGIDTD